MKTLLALAFPVFALAAVWPEEFAGWRRASVAPAAVADRALWDEWGLKEAETAVFEGHGSKFSATGYLLQDSTGALAALESERPAARGTMLAHGNYLLWFPERKPTDEELAALRANLRNVDTTPPPALAGDLPERDLISASERYILGPVGLARFQPAIPPSAAAFSLGAEARGGVFRTSAGEMKLVIFNYPTPQIAMERAGALGQVPGAIVKRAGPLVAVAVAPPDRDAAERTLALVRYRAQITLDERAPSLKDNAANLVLGAMMLAGVLLAFCLVSGLAFGGLRAILRWRRKGEDPEAMIRLRLGER
jgi:hypothetical protein